MLRKKGAKSIKSYIAQPDPEKKEMCLKRIYLFKNSKCKYSKMIE